MKIENNNKIEDGINAKDGVKRKDGEIIDNNTFIILVMNTKIWLIIWVEKLEVTNFDNKIGLKNKVNKYLK